MRALKIVLSIIGLLVLMGQANAASVTLAWDANDPAPDGYRVFQRIEGEAYDYSAPVNTEPITGTTYMVDGLAAGEKYFFVVRAVVGDDESGDSNEVGHVAAGDVLPCLNLLTATGDSIEDIQAGTYLIEGFPDFIAKIEPVPEENDQPPYSTNAAQTIYHGVSCRWYDPSRGIADPADCPTCRPCKICGVDH
jgi:hypothetical protein